MVIRGMAKATTKKKTDFKALGRVRIVLQWLPPIPLKRLLKRRRAFLTPYDKLRIEAQILNDNCRGDGCRWQPFIADRVEDENMLCV